MRCNNHNDIDFIFSISIYRSNVVNAYTQKKIRQVTPESRSCKILLYLLQGYVSTEELAIKSNLKYRSVNQMIYAMRNNGFNIIKVPDPKKIGHHLYHVEGYQKIDEPKTADTKNKQPIKPFGNAPWYVITYARRQAFE